jgi:hypothetical protein
MNGDFICSKCDNQASLITKSNKKRFKIGGFKKFSVNILVSMLAGA